MEKNKEIIDSFQSEVLSKVMMLKDVHDMMNSKGIKIEYSSNVYSKVKRFIKDSIKRFKIWYDRVTKSY